VTALLVIIERFPDVITAVRMIDVSATLTLRLREALDLERVAANAAASILIDHQFDPLNAAQAVTVERRFQGAHDLYLIIRYLR
jgi:hypothetical protein